ncbi:M28 family peptidase [Clostridium sp. CS001]|uniref:M28 family peptidase n=1 Tax=Clostridium sp. CS001 TaxID=2880648 RepID=UPI001CF16059|nr:M28 family peptidase [Clostridium sp. CS001]MCB2290656.1 M28 family peptidase [Clostridium sp. CS001]
MRPILKIGAIIAISLAFSSCSYGAINQDTKEKNKSNEQLVQVQSPVKIPTIEETVNTLCSDEFEGRLVGSKGNEKAGGYISNIFEDIGLTPLFEDNYYEPYIQEVYKKYGLIDKDDKPENKEVNNVVGVIKGKDSKKAVVISAHFDHLGYLDGKIIRGALDNASGVAALIEIAHMLNGKSKEQSFNIDFADVEVKGLGDHLRFEGAGIPNVFIVQENVTKLVHKPTDIPDTLDYAQIDEIANAISDFVETNDGITFN